MLTLHLPVTDPKLLVSGNQRIHHHQRAKVVRHWRELARDAVPADALAMTVRAHITVTFRYPTKHRRDVCNLYPFVVKALIDGLVDAKLLHDDSDQYVVGPDMRRDPVNGPHAIRIDIEEIP